MKYISKIFAFTISIFISTSAIAAPETYSFESNHTTVEWRANHFGFSNPSGKFMDVQGTIKLDEADPANSSVNVTIIPASISTGITKFDDHLKNSDFFNVEKFSTATFTSNKVEIVDKNKAKVHGTLSLMDIKKDIVLDITLNKIGKNPMNNIKTAGFTATTTIKRSDFGIKYAIPNVSDEVDIHIEAEAQKQ